MTVLLRSFVRRNGELVSGLSKWSQWFPSDRVGNEELGENGG